MNDNPSKLDGLTIGEIIAIVSNPRHPLYKQMQEHLISIAPAISEKISAAFEKMNTELKKFVDQINPHIPELEKFCAEIEAADKEAVELIHFLKNTHVPVEDISKLPPVKVMTVMSIMSKMDDEAAKKAGAILEEWKKWKSGLDIGRAEGAKKRSSQAKELHELLSKAISDLFNNGQSWKMSNKQIASYLSLNGFAQHYTDDTLIRKISPIAAKIRKAAKE